MANQTDFLNDALGQIGASTITAIDDGSLNADYCARFWPPLRRSMIRAHHWNFATSRAELAQDVGTPPFEFQYYYTLPAELLKVIEYNGVSTVIPDNLQLYPLTGRFKIEGRKLLTNDGEVRVVYLKDVENPDEWDGIFYQAAATWLAAKLAMAIPKSAKLAAELMHQAQVILLPLGMAVDGQEGSDDRFVVDDFIRVR